MLHPSSVPECRKAFLKQLRTAFEFLVIFSSSRISKNIFFSNSVWLFTYCFHPIEVGDTDKDELIQSQMPLQMKHLHREHSVVEAAVPEATVMPKKIGKTRQKGPFLIKIRLCAQINIIWGSVFMFLSRWFPPNNVCLNLQPKWALTCKLVPSTASSPLLPGQRYCDCSTSPWEPMMYNPVRPMCLKDEIQYIKGAPASQMIGWGGHCCHWVKGRNTPWASRVSV